MTRSQQSFHRIVAALAALAALAVTPAAADADPFGGFSGDHRTYLSGRDDICRPLVVNARGTAEGTPSCAKAEARAVSAAGFRRARSGGLRASHDGRTLIVSGADGAEIVRWQAPAPIARVVGVYASDAGGLVAVDYVARRLGRSGIDVVGFALPGGAAAVSRRQAADPAGASATAPSPTPAAPAGTEPTDASAAERARAEALLRRRRWAPAAAAFEKLVTRNPADVRARYGLATALARQRKRAAAAAQLTAIADSGEPAAIELLVDARFDPAFEKLRRRADFRKAVARDPAAPASAYERLVGEGHVWEQPVAPCKEAGVKVEFDRRTREFALRVVIRCSTQRDQMFLGGTWSARGADEVVLVFPNDDDADETVVCKMRRCEGGADCVACQLDAGLAFELRRK